MVNVGDRVLAIRNAGDGKAYIYGYGTYDGEHKPPGFPIENPRIKLDNGNFIYGYQCWWGSAKLMDKKLAGMEIIEVPMHEKE